MDSAMKNHPPVPVVRLDAWKKVLSTAAVFYVFLLAALLLTGNSNLFPSLVMVGSFMVPVAYVTFFYERRHIFTHIEWHMRVCAAEVSADALPEGWITLDESHALPTAYRVCFSQKG